MRYLQQDDYDPSRFWKWIKETRAFDRRGSILACFGMLFEIIGISSIPFLFIGYLALAFFEKNPAYFGKKPFVQTERAKRILWTALALQLFTFMPLFFFVQNGIFIPIAALLACQAAPFFLLLSVAVLSIDEKKRQKALMRAAKLRFLEVNPQVIGITGSYGKTTTKHFLSKLLNMTLGPAFHPEKGVNTPMGITREINTCLRDKTPYAVIEMAAYGQGSISRLCSLTPPQGGIFTTIGLAHLERFGNQETIRKAKAELAEAVPKNGFLVLNGDDPHCRRIGIENQKETMLYYGFNEDLGPLNLKISIIGSDKAGTELSLEWKAKHYFCKVPLFGKPLIANLGAAFAAACHLGAEPSYAASALPHIDPVDNRLQAQSQGGILYLHDAYNSNPSGFEAALEVLKSMPAERRILVTPGMIELGPLQYSENERIASIAAEKVDAALIIGSLNRTAFKSGLIKKGFLQKNIHFFNTRDRAFTFLSTMKKPGDVILIENDLPDLYEAIESF